MGPEISSLNMVPLQFSSPAPPHELKLPSFMDATQTLAPLEPPLPVSYLLSMQDPLRYPHFPDLRTEFSQLVPPSAHAVDQDHTPVDTASEFDRATLLPIIRIAYPSLRRSVQDSIMGWHNVSDDQNMGPMDDDRHVNEIDGLYYQSVDMEGPKHEIDPQEAHYGLRRNVPPTIASARVSTGVYGLLCQEEPRPWPVEVGERRDNVDTLERAVKIDQITTRRPEPGVANLTDDKPSPSTALGCSGLTLLKSFTGVTNSFLQIASETSSFSWALEQIARSVAESNELVQEEQFSCGSSRTDCGNPHLETTNPKGIAVLDKLRASLPVGASQAPISKNSAQIVTSIPEERTSFGTESDHARHSSALDEEDKYLAPASPAVGTLSVSNINDLRFPEISRKRRNVIKKAVGWVRKNRNPSFSAGVSKCGPASCTGRELESKRRRISSFSSRGLTRGTFFPIHPQVRPRSRIKQSNEQVKFSRKFDSGTSSDMDTRGTVGNLLALPVKETSPVGKDASHMTQEQVNSPLSAALSIVLSESGSHGLTVCEALRKLLKQGHSKLFGSSNQPRAIQVKIALTRCSDFKQLNSRRFKLKNHRMVPNKNVKGTSGEQEESAAGNSGQETGISKKVVLKRPRTAGIYSEHVAQSSAVCSTAEQRCHGQEQHFEQCHKTDGKQWRCSQQAKVGFLYCEHHHQRQSKARVKKFSSRRNFHQLSVKQGSKTAADGSLGQSRGCWQGQELKFRRCHRTDGRHWQCSKPVKSGCIYCEHHQGKRKKGMLKGSGTGQITAARDVKQEVQGQQSIAVGSMVTAVKAKVKGSAQSRKSKMEHRSKKTMHPSKACSVNWSQTGCKRTAEGNPLGRTVTSQESKQELHVSEQCSVSRPHTVAHLKQHNGIGHGHRKVVEEVKEEQTRFKTCAAARERTAVCGLNNGMVNFYEQPDVKGCIAMSDSADYILHRKMEANCYGQITEEKDHSPAGLAVDALSSARSSTSMYCFPSKQSTALPGKNGHQLERCHRKDGKRWQCSQHCKPGYIYCDHHEEYRHKGKTVRGVQEKCIIQKMPKKPAVRCFEGFNGEGCSANHTRPLLAGEQLQKELPRANKECFWSATPACGNLEEVVEQSLKRCHRTDGKGWQCSHQAKQGFNYCEHHQIYLSRRTTSKGAKKGKENYTSFGPVKSWSDLLTSGCGSGVELSKSTLLCMQPVV